MPNLFDNSYKSARRALADTQIRGKNAEKAVGLYLESKNIKFQKRIKEKYLDCERADIEVDFKIDNINNFETHISVTHSNPLIPGHSNENKLHQKISELYLFKIRSPKTRIVLVIGGDTAKWSPYVLKTFELFFDDVVYVEGGNFDNEMSRALKCPLKNSNFWLSEKKIVKEVKFFNEKFNVCSKNLRQVFFQNIILKLSRKAPPQYPNQIKNSILKKLGEASTESLFWSYIKNGQYEKIWEERNYFNPLEAITEIILEKNNVWFKGGLGKSVAVHHSVLHDLDFKSTRFTEDFLLYSNKYRKRIYIQCKSSAGGPRNTSKALPSRAREQIGRSILYRSTIGANNELKSNQKDYLSIYILDGHWNYPKSYQLKYIHLLQIAGADFIINGYDLLDNKFEIKPNNALEKIIKELRCGKNPIKTE